MVMVNSITGQPTVAGDKDAILETFRPGTGPGSSHYGSSQVANATNDQQSADDFDGTAPPGGALPGMPAGDAPMMPVNARIPAGTAVPSPPRALMTGTGGLY